MNKEESVNNQLKMCRDAGRFATRESLRKFIAERHKERFNLVQSLRRTNETEIRWHEVEEFDAITESQEKILDGLINDRR